MDIFWRLLLGHLVADFTLQTNFINRWKRSSPWGMLVHCLIHPVCYVLLTLRSLGEVWTVLGSVSLPGWACIGLLFAAHFIEDEWRVTTIFRFKTPDNTLYFLWDQVIHAAVIFAVAPIGLSNGEPLIPEKWPVLGCLAVLLTHMTTVTTYFLEKDIYGGSYPGFDEKYLGMAERLVLGLSFLLPHNGWLLVAPVWLAGMALLRGRRLLDLSWFSYGFGGAVSVACGLFARSVYYL
ncbi:MAG: DUF3307 domain-containing protein [Elusimicrobia bacterium]|nr:DUF3307 domain-containing protein [Elusimicrobiota bacterium]